MILVHRMRGVHSEAILLDVGVDVIKLILIPADCHLIEVKSNTCLIELVSKSI